MSQRDLPASPFPGRQSGPFRILRAILLALLDILDPPPSPPDPEAASTQEPAPDQAAALAQFHAAEYASERNSVDVWKTLQYALVPIAFGAWYLLSQVQKVLGETLFSWASAAVLPLCFVAYQKAMVDALTGILLVEEYIRGRAIKLAGTDEFWFHEPVYRKQVPPDAAYGWYWPPLLSFASPVAMLIYRLKDQHSFALAHLWPDLTGYILCTGIALFVGGLSRRGLTLNRKIDEHLRAPQFSVGPSGKLEVQLAAQPH
jgi:hypothetical protein